MPEVSPEPASRPATRHRHLLASLVALVVLIVASVIWFIGWSSDDDAATSAAPRTDLSDAPPLSAETTDFGGIDLRVPVDWHVVEPDFTTAAMTQPLGWITNADDLLPECRPDDHLGGHVSCGAPIDQVGDGGVLIFASIGPALGDDFVATDTVAGLPAHESVSDGTDCQPGATSGINVAIKETDSVITFWMCFGPESDDVQAAARNMLATATYHRR